MDDRFQHTTYLVRKKILQMFGATFHIFDEAGQMLFYTKQRALSLKEDIRLYADEQMQADLLVISGRQVVDFAGTFDVTDPATGWHVGALRRKGLKSILKDEWVILDPDDKEMGLIQEDSVVKALVRRFITNWLPQTYYASVGGSRVAVFRQNRNPFVAKIQADFSPDVNGLLDRRLGVAAAVLLCGIEGKQK